VEKILLLRLLPPPPNPALHNKTVLLLARHQPEHSWRLFGKMEFEF
jgi:hypothetical protein